MAPTLVREPFHRAGWVYEEKVDGWRTLAYKDGARVRLVNLNGRCHTRRFPDLAAAVARLSARTLVLDGEVAIYDDQLRSRFDWLREPDPDAVASPPLFLAFDLLYLDRRDLAGGPLRGRHAGWRTSSRAASGCSWCGVWPAMAMRPGARWSRAATRATWPRTTTARRRTVRRAPGSR